MKKIAALLTVILSTFTLASCHLSKDTAPSGTDSKLIYSNLIDDESKTILEDALEKANIDTSYINTAIHLIDDYNEHMTLFKEADKDYMEKTDLFAFQSGFTATQDSYINYGDYYFQMKKWYNGRDYDDIYCRTLAFLLIQDAIQVASPLREEEWGISNEDDFLYGDYAALTSYPLIDLDADKYPAYFTLFHPVLNADQNEDFAQQLKNQWCRVGVSFDTDISSLITIWSVINNENDMTIEHSHAGILIEDADGFLFIEKTNPLAPYQMTKFSSIAQLKQYLIDTLTAYFVRYEMPIPEMIVLQNDNEI